MKKIKSLIKACNVAVLYTTIFSLLQNPFVNSNLANAAEPKTENSKAINADDVKQVSGIVLGAFKTYFDEKQKMTMMQMAQARNQQMMAQFGPGCRKPDGTPCFVSQAKYFPECTVPASMSNMPTNVCSSATPDVNQISSMIAFENIAQGWSNYYDQMMNEASNSAAPAGLRCLKDRQKAADSQLVEMINSLQRLQDRLNQDKQVFRDNNKKLLEDMNSANEELFGTSKGDLKNKTTDFAKFFSPSCQTVIGKDNIARGKLEGLNGILQGLSIPNKAAGDFTLNRNVIENDIRAEANKISSTIAKNGVQSFLESGYIPQSEQNQKNLGKAIEGNIKKYTTEFMTAKGRIDKVLSEVGYKAPALDSNFSVDLEEFMAGADGFFRKKFVNDCVTGGDRGVAIPVDQILASLQQKSTGSAGTARDDYREALRKILESDSMIEDKMASIKVLESGYPDITVTYKDVNQQRITESPYSLFMKTIAACEQSYAQGDQFTKAGTDGSMKEKSNVSSQKKVERAKAALAELKTLNDSFASRVSQGVLSQLLDCGGSAPKSGSCNDQALEVSSPNFCVSHASQCANEIQGCYAEANKHVQTRKTKMENLSKAFNKNVEAMIARSNALYEQQKVAVSNMTKFIQAKFPGSNFEIPADMFVTMPELKKDQYGVEMAADGNLKEILDGEGSMPKRIEKLKEMFKKQKENVNKELEEYIALQKSAMEKQKGRWDSLAKECKVAVNRSSEELAKANAEGQKKQAEEDGNTADFCSRYSALSENPLGACDDAKDLATDAKKIVRRLDSSVAKNLNSFKQLCNQVNNEKSEGTEKSSASESRASRRTGKKIPSTGKLCIKDEKLVKDNKGFIDALKTAEPSLKRLITESNQESIINFLMGKEANLSSDITNEVAQDLLKEVREKVRGSINTDKNTLVSKFKKEVGDKVVNQLSIGDKAESLCEALVKGQINSAKDIESLEGIIGMSDSDSGAMSVIRSYAVDNSESVNIELQRDEAKSLGEKLSGAPCDAQNKSNLAKGFNDFNLNAFDNNFLSGKSK